MGSCAQRENLQNQPGSSQHASIEGDLEVSLLGWAEVSIKNDQFSTQSCRLLTDLFHFALADMGGWMGKFSRTGNAANGFQTGGPDQFVKFIATGQFRVGLNNVNEQGAATRRWSVKEQKLNRN